MPPYPPICKSRIEIERGKRKLRKTPTIILDRLRQIKREDVDMAPDHTALLANQLERAGVEGRDRAEGDR